MHLRTLLLLNGLFFFTLSLGIALGAKLNVGNISVLSLFVLGVVFLFTTAVLWKREYQVHKSQIKKWLQVRNRPIALQDAFRAMRTFGNQPPLIQDERVESHAFSLDAPRSYTPPYALSRIYVEHWAGPEALVRENQRSFLLETQQIVSFVLDTGDIQIEPRNLRDGQRIDGVIHFISLAQSVE